MRLEKFTITPIRGDKVKVYLSGSEGVAFGTVKGVGYVKKIDRDGNFFKRQVIMLRECPGVSWTVEECRFRVPIGKVILE